MSGKGGADPCGRSRFSRVADAWAKPKTWRRLHATLTLGWFAAIIPTVLWWRESVFWVALISCYANAAAHFGAWQGSRAEDSSAVD